ncbi:uncharacterized protein MYCGRDRAFT_92654 [Zymoseptoria tritici IPO323]|uniref:Uncharacterized protein n=1 Tax=Zymoseptoria tritici (strain CBS 115943 / IPO323) TaxID=336722 RepID=F9X936_ZYMTI|nr:uncharacterized protein MYCGRDRAFT_92654 [Zymoseptoria tritici IPO323]EGP88024.1 hypothetical protein MYCGRDRAFT_92654 [Zymoseptoria tritici IPO323]
MLADIGAQNKNVDSNGPSPDNASSARRQPSTPLVPDPIETPAGAGQLLSLTPSTESDAVAMGLLSTEAARTLLQRFKTTLTPHFPFVVCYRRLAHFPDKYILPIVQIQHTMEQADASDHDEREVLKSTHLTQLILCLETIKGALLFPLAESAMLTMHLHTGIVHACHTNVCTDAALNLLPTDERWPQWRLDALSTGLIAAKSSLSCFLSLPLGHEKSFNNSEWIQLGFVTTCAARLAALSSQKVIRQETHHLRRFLGISDGLKDTIRRLESLSTSTADDDGERDVFYHYRQRVQRIQAWFQAQQERVQRESMQTVSDTADAAAWNGSARQQLPLASSGAQRAWNPGQALPQDSPVLPMDIAWREGDLFDWLPDDLMDMENFGQTFPFDAEGT